MRKFKIVCKTKETVKVKLPGKICEWTWKEFNKMFDIQDLYWAVMKPEEEEKQEKIESMLDDLAVQILLSKANPEELNLKLGLQAIHISEKTGLTISEIKEIVYTRLKRSGMLA